MLQKFLLLTASVLALCTLALFQSPFAHAAPESAYIVNSSADTNDGQCNAQNCTLREAINAANASAGLDTINFHIGGCACIIYPLAVLPPISDPVIINGYTENGAMPANSDNPTVLKITLRGSLAPAAQPGLRITGGGSTVKGLVINDFDFAGIWLRDKGGNTIAGNFIGTFASGISASPNDRGILISDGSTKNFIGGTAYELRNLISGNTLAGVEVANTGADNNTIVGNIIGVNINSDPRGNGKGIVLHSKKNLVGLGSTPYGINLIAANLGAGIEISGANAKGNVVAFNLIGSFDGPAAGNGTYGVLLADGATKNTIGTVDSPNYIFGNGANGIAVLGDTTKQNSLRGNFIESNGGLGIDLNQDGVTPNDTLDADGGANLRQNFPTVSFVVNKKVKGKLVGTPNMRYAIELYATLICDVTGYGEGQFIGSVTITTDAAGKANWNYTHANVFQDQLFITAIATDRKGNSSEFSKCKQVATN